MAELKSAIGMGGKLLFAAVLGAIAIHSLSGWTTQATHVPPVRPKVQSPPRATAPQPAVAIAPVLPSETPFIVRRVLAIDGPFEHGEYVWDDDGVPPGPIVITIDLSAQTLSVFRGGYEIGAAVILYGAGEKASPTGIFSITEKDADHVSNLYDAPMPYMLRLTDDGVSIHGSDVEWGAATHGCIGVPTRFAKLLFGQAKLGDRVIITDGEKLHLGDAIPAA